ncbi:transcriptional regulator [Pseudoxanthomonas broegbernensis]|uniref:Transcriptional regulator n=1 Tax=Pseudoxanthomonas broegbernensis TaxID=83619 RepID=A0A7V8GKS4_9GAMM|nr:helix-turn-helix transcriptional regulator [Pseudoxanthomonas broegbernensis]KAF1685349.1 transcriptional regulator [Pseudoxanthomonas broegbernensis]MBB6066220.1 HTH-type transcriptional regulator/antitoxin HipB [Pseudoxanthomonas broegbernensis]
MNQYIVHAAEQLPTLLKAFRKEAGLTQVEAALRLGITQQTLSALERNAQKVSAERLLQLLSLLGVEMVLQKKSAKQVPDPALEAPAW